MPKSGGGAWVRGYPVPTPMLNGYWCTRRKKVATVQIQWSSERIFDAEMPTAKQQAFQTPHQDKTTVSLQYIGLPIPLVNVNSTH